MITKISGIVLSKMIYRDKDEIAKILLDNGEKVSLLFYGSRSGKQGKGSLIELGHALNIDLAPRPWKSSQTEELFVAKEWSLRWAHSSIRSDYRAFYFMCLLLEIMMKVTVNADLSEDETDDKSEHGGLFKILSNSLYYADLSLGEKNFLLNGHLFLFLIKLLTELGVAPLLTECIFCEKDLKKFSTHFLNFERGGFVCPLCLDNSLKEEVLNYNPILPLSSPPVKKDTNPLAKSGPDLFPLFMRMIHLKFKDAKNIPAIENQVVKRVFAYLCYQFHFDERDFKSLGLVF